MDPLTTSALISGGASVLGGNAANRGNSRQARLGREFTREQMRMKYQWQMEDMRKAGLNPILAAGQSPGTGPSPTATMTNEASGAASSALAAAQVRQVKAQTRKTNVEADAIEGIKKPAVTGAGMVDDGLEALKTLAETMGVNSAKGQIKVEKLLDDLKHYTDEGETKLRSWFKGFLEDDPNSGWYDRFKNEMRKRRDQRRK